MKLQTIYSPQKGVPLFEGTFNSFRDCVESAVHKGVDLAGADLRSRNLANACLDDGLFEAADFTGANLAGANLSETRLAHANFKNTDLYNTCFAYADLRGCNFENANFGASDVNGADLSGAKFTTLSCFSLDFASTQHMDNCRFRHDSGKEFTLSRPPVVIRGIGPKITVLAESCWMSGNAVHPYPENFHPFPFLEQITRTKG